MNDNLRKAAQPALDWLEWFEGSTSTEPTSRLEDSIQDLRTALAQQDVCEWEHRMQDIWSPSCKRYVGYKIGTPANKLHMAYCHQCGKPIKFKESENEPS